MVHVHCYMLMLAITSIYVLIIEGAYIDVPISVIHQGYVKMDTNSDGILSLEEFEAVVSKDDKNGDGCVTREEYEDGAPVKHELTDKMFTHFEYQHTGCLNIREMASEFHTIDTNDDGTADVFEYEVYFKKLMISLFMDT